MNVQNAASNESESSVSKKYGSVQSGSIKAIAKALQTVQSKMAAAVKDADNDFFQSKYATLNAVWQSVQPLLDEAGLAVTQFPGATLYVGDDRYLDFETTLMHSESGEFMKGITMVPYGKAKDANKTQAYGSAVTYARRYCLSSMMGIVVDGDDDANAASGNTSHNRNGSQPPRQGQQQQRQQQPTGQQGPSNQAPPNQQPTSQPPEQPTALQRLGAFLKQAGCNGKDDANLLIDFVAPSHNWETVQNEEVALFVINLVNEGITAGRFTVQSVLQTARATEDASATFN